MSNQTDRSAQGLAMLALGLLGLSLVLWATGVLLWALVLDILGGLVLGANGRHLRHTGQTARPKPRSTKPATTARPRVVRDGRRPSPAPARRKPARRTPKQPATPSPIPPDDDSYSWLLGEE